MQGVVAGIETKQQADDLTAGNVAVTVHVSDDYVKPADTIAPAVRVALAGTAGNDGWLVTSPIALITASDNAAAPIAKLELAVGDVRRNECEHCGKGCDWRGYSEGACACH